MPVKSNRKSGKKLVKKPARKSVRKPRARRSASRRVSRRVSQPWITRKGKLGGPGFLTKSAATQHKLLDKCVGEYGYRSCLGSVMVLSRNRSINAKYGQKIEALKNYLKRKYGGVGSFGRKSRKSKQAPRRRKVGAHRK